MPSSRVTALSHAASHDHWRKVQLLLDAGADDLDNALAWACRQKIGGKRVAYLHHDDGRVTPTCEGGCAKTCKSAGG